MRHRVKRKLFNRDSAHRQAMLTNLLSSLVLHGSVTCSLSRAKELKRWADKAIGQAQKNSLHSRRELHKIFGKTDIVNTLVDKIAPAMSDRQTGFTTLKEVGKRRGDNTLMYRVELVKKPAEMGSFTAPKSETANKKQKK